MLAACPRCPPARQHPSQFPQLRRRHHAQFVKKRVDQHVSLKKQHAIIQRTRLLADLFLQHHWSLVIGECAIGSAGIVEHGRFDRQLAPVVACIFGFLKPQEPIFLEHSRIRRIGSGRIGAPGHWATHLPTSKLGGENRGRRRRIRGKRRSAQKQEENNRGSGELHSGKGTPYYLIRLPAAR